MVVGLFCVHNYGLLLQRAVATYLWTTLAKELTLRDGTYNTLFAFGYRARDTIRRLPGFDMHGVALVHVELLNSLVLDKLNSILLLFLLSVLNPDPSHTE